MVDLADVLPLPSETPFRRLRLLMTAAFGLIGVFVLGFGAWSAVAPLESAAIAGGLIEVESSRKTIQHLEGGIVSRILVKEGDRVAAGQPLVLLDETRARSTLDALQGQLWDAQAREARLLAERDGRTSIQFPLPLRRLTKENAAVEEILSGQVRVFDTRRRLHASQLEVVLRRKAQTEREIIGLRHQEAAAAKRASIIKEELAAIAPLVAKGLQTRPRLLQLEREQAEIDGRRGETVAAIARAEQVLGESEAQALKLESNLQSEVAQSLRDTQSQIFQLQERIQAATDVLARSEVRAPEAGVVTDLRVHTPGGVIAEGQPLMDLVPHRDRLVVRAQVRTDDIDLVRVGLPARVRLLAYKQRRVPPVGAVVTHVSADRLTDATTGKAYYLAHVAIDENELRALPEVEIVPGMPVEVLIKTGEFTVAHYFLGPVLNSFDRAFREN
jgi:HlyD family secretion protein